MTKLTVSLAASLECEGWQRELGIEFHVVIDLKREEKILESKTRGDR